MSISVNGVKKGFYNIYYKIKEIIYWKIGNSKG